MGKWIRRKNYLSLFSPENTSYLFFPSHYIIPSLVTVPCQGADLHHTRQTRYKIHPSPLCSACSWPVSLGFWESADSKDWRTRGQCQQWGKSKPGPAWGQVRKSLLLHFPVCSFPTCTIWVQAEVTSSKPNLGGIMQNNQPAIFPSVKVRKTEGRQREVFQLEWSSRPSFEKH